MSPFDGVNLPAVLVASAASFVLGGAWYSPALFLPAWTRESGVNAETEKPHATRVFALAFVFSTIAAFAFATWLGPRPSLAHALAEALRVGLCFVAACFGINYQFANKSLVLLAIDAGYHVVQFLIFAAVLGLWH